MGRLKGTLMGSSASTYQLLRMYTAGSSSRRKLGAQEQFISPTLKEKLKSIHPTLEKRLEEVASFRIQYLRPISFKYTDGGNVQTVRLVVKYQVDPQHFFHVKLIPPSVSTNSFSIGGISGVKARTDPVIVF